MNIVKAERKLTAPFLLAEDAYACLRHYCRPDPEYPYGIVHSVCFDTQHLACYEEKLNGMFNKAKLRLRWYDDPAESNTDRVDVFLEIKSKQGGCRNKIRHRFSERRTFMEQASLDDPRWKDLVAHTCGDAGVVLRDDLFPVVTVVYERYRFVCPFTDARVCLDTHIHVDRTNTQILPDAASLKTEKIVLEIKDVDVVEVPWLGTLYKMGFRASAFSKFGVCVSQTLQGGYA